RLLEREGAGLEVDVPALEGEALSAPPRQRVGDAAAQGHDRIQLLDDRLEVGALEEALTRRRLFERMDDRDLRDLVPLEPEAEGPEEEAERPVECRVRHLVAPAPLDDVAIPRRGVHLRGLPATEVLPERSPTPLRLAGIAASRRLVVRLEIVEQLGEEDGVQPHDREAFV